MKRLFLFLSLGLTSVIVLAQHTNGTATDDTQDELRNDTRTELQNDTLQGRELISFEGRNYRAYDGFLLDLDALMQPVSAEPMGLMPPSLLYNPFTNYRTIVTDYIHLFRRTGTIGYGQATLGCESPFFTLKAYNGKVGYDDHGTYFGSALGIFGPAYRNLGSIPLSPTLRSATFRLNNGWRITTYGEYDADGHPVQQSRLLPGQRKAFNGAFEMKSENGNFGIRIGVQRY